MDIREARENIQVEGIDLGVPGYMDAEALKIAVEIMDKYLAIIDGAPAMLKVKNFKRDPNETWLLINCGACDGRLHTESVDTNMWNLYLEDHYHPELPKFCPHCGTKVTVLTRFLHTPL